MRDPAVPTIRHAAAGDVSAVRDILFASLDAGELPGTLPRDLESVIDRIGVETGPMLVSVADEAVTGFFDPHYPLLVIRADCRRQRHGTALVNRALADAHQRGEVELELAPPLGSVVAEAFAASLGFAYRSSLWQLRLGPEVVVPQPVFPEGYAVRPYLPGPDDETYLELVNVSFADHPAPLHVTMEMLQHSHARPGFDAAGIGVVPAADDPNRLVAFCRTIFDATDGNRYALIGTLGVLPEDRQLGLGRALLHWGIHYLRSRGAEDVVLAVEGRNAKALRLYEGTGFVQEQEWPRWAKATSGTT